MLPGTFTKTQVKNLMLKNGIKFDRIGGVGVFWEVELPNEANARKFRKYVTKNVGGYTTGCGSIVLRVGYKPAGEWGDKSSSHHY